MELSVQRRMQALSEQVEELMVRHPQIDHQRVTLLTSADRVTIHGQVASFFEKQIAQEAIRQISGVGRIVNKLVVDSNN